VYYNRGSTVEIEFYWNAPHGGWHQFRVCPNATMNSWYTTPGYHATPANDAAIEECFAANPLDMGAPCDDLGKGNGWCFMQDLNAPPNPNPGLPPPGLGNSPAKQTITLPEDFLCEHCLLSWRWDAWRSANEIYTQCVDMSVMDGPLPTPAPTAWRDDISDGSGYSCEQQASWGQCNEDWMTCAGNDLCCASEFGRCCAASCEPYSPTPAPPTLPPTPQPPTNPPTPQPPTQEPTPAPPTQEPTLAPTPPPTNCVGAWASCDPNTTSDPCCAGHTCMGSVWDLMCYPTA
jgi:hypothetical protein